MSSQNDSGFKSYLASGAIPAFLAVKVNSDGTITAANGLRGCGVTQEDIADANYGMVKLWAAPGTFMIQASGTSITAGTTYSIITGGYAGATGTGYGNYLIAEQAGVASNGIVLEFNETY
jgi:hypothetical protein